MRKIKKINGYLVVKFNARELSEYEGTAIGEYGVIDAELYSGNLDIDRGAMEYDNAGSLEEAVELARGLESELDVNEPTATYTVVKETDDSTKELEVDPELLVNEWEESLAFQIESKRYSGINPETARHELYGFMVALKGLGMIDSDDCFVESHHFEPGGVPGSKPDAFVHLPPEKRDSGTARQVYALGRVLEGDCPANDCRVYLNIFNMCRELDEQAPLLTGWAREVVEAELRKHYFTLETMFTMNYAIRQYKKGIQP